MTLPLPSAPASRLCACAHMVGELQGAEEAIVLVPGEALLAEHEPDLLRGVLRHDSARPCERMQSLLHGVKQTPS